jgi:hypothetical protein
MTQPRRKKGVEQAPEDQNPAQKPDDKNPAGPVKTGKLKHLTANPIVGQLAKGLAPTATAAFIQGMDQAGADPPRVYAESSDVSEVVSFEGYLGATVPHPPGADETDDQNLWCVFYLDWDLRSWLLIERTGIVRHKRIKDAQTDEDPHDVIWVRVDATVGSGRGSASVESLFLKGQFTSAGDFEAEATSGGLSPATGKFCGRSPWCCGGKTVRR